MATLRPGVSAARLCGPEVPCSLRGPPARLECLFPASPPDVTFITTATFVWKVLAITMVSCLPLYVLKYLKRKLSPPSYSKLTS